MSTKNDGGSAYPINCQELPNGERVWNEPGMSLRDAAALAALPGILYMAAHGAHDAARTPEGVASEAYKIADAMIAERSR